ncbi:hypothetical protein A1O7_02529 [Cladophialophora yegresii CBS 114405]|uniref:Uncharacterized protein n=1 Tax=Cladophialophora yegresii CBS 114405 TaxID=1182544 RepID=W9WC01_9EURO|nr:uncharacterized protein A1O7_02529 [Cladophialophora yegresii CBS 114405]EXJ62096.1 hypothetical protein A1O7_02529 [Cladophialophora yegresii CBS 114405]
MQLSKALFALASLVATVTGSATRSASSLETRQAGWPACQRALNCTFDQIQASTMQDRHTYVRYMQSTFFGPLNAANQFRAIEGVITFFISKNLGAPDSWISYVDTGIVEAIQRGGAMALGLSTETGGNPGTTLWRDFLVGMRDGEYTTREAHDYAWGLAEATATEWSKAKKADILASAPATRRELNWYQFTVLFRWIIRHESETILVLRPLFWTSSDDFVYWLTDVTRSEPTVYGSEAAWAISGTLSFSLGGLLEFSQDILDLLRVLYDRWSDLF